MKKSLVTLSHIALSTLDGRKVMAAAGTASYVSSEVTVHSEGSPLCIVDGINPNYERHVLQNALVRIRGVDRDPWLHYPLYGGGPVFGSTGKPEKNSLFLIRSPDVSSGQPIKFGDRVRFQKVETGLWLFVRDGRLCGREGGVERGDLFRLEPVHMPGDWCIEHLDMATGHINRHSFKGDETQASAYANSLNPHNSPWVVIRKTKGVCPIDI